MNDSANSTYLEALSVATIRSYTVSQWIFLVVGMINTAASLTSFTVLYRGKKFTGRTFVFLRVFFVHDCVMTTYMMLSYALYQLYHNIYGVPEVMGRANCFLFTGLLMCMVINSSMLTLMVSFDRLLVSLNPTKGAGKFEWDARTTSMLVGPFVVSTGLYVGTLFDRADTAAIVTYCSPRAATGPGMVLILWYSQLVPSYLALASYVFMLSAARCKLHQVWIIKYQKSIVW